MGGVAAGERDGLVGGIVGEREVVPDQVEGALTAIAKGSVAELGLMANPGLAERLDQLLQQQRMGGGLDQ
jgi:hypothetical protein